MSPRTKAQFEAIREQSRERILHAALELFATQGFHKTSIAQIANKAEVSKGLMYNYFDSKESLLETLILQAVEHAEESITLHVLPESDPKMKIKSLIEASFKLVESNQKYWKLFTLISVQEGIIDKMMDITKPNQEKYNQMLAATFQELGFEDVEKEMLLFNAIMDGIGIHYVFADKHYPFEKMKNYIIEKYCK